MKGLGGSDNLGWSGTVYLSLTDAHPCLLPDSGENASHASL
jgi:hypothetical protein